MKKLFLIAAMAVASLSAAAQDETFTLNVGSFDAPTTEEAKEGAGSWWERAPFQFYTKYSGIQIIYPATLLQDMAGKEASIKEIVFKYGDEGSTVEVEANLGLLIENTTMGQFEQKPESQQYMWVNYDPSTSASELQYSVELYYLEDEEIHFVLDTPLTYTDGNLLVTAWSEVTNGVEAQAMVTYAVRTGKYTTMAFGSDRYDFAHCYDTGIQETAQGPNKYVPVTKFVYTTNSSISDVAADTQAPATYYNLQGVKVDGALAPGLYIKQQGTTASKILVK